MLAKELVFVMQLSNHEPVEASTPNSKESRRLCNCSFDGGLPRTTDWHRRHQAHHLAEFPEVDQITRDNLAMFVDMAAQRERKATDVDN